MTEAKDIPIPLELLKQHKMQRLLIGVLFLEFTIFVIFSIWMTSFVRQKEIPLGTIQIGTVKYGNLKIYINGEGMLKPRKERWIASADDGVVDNIYVHPGSLVIKGKPILKLNNPDITDSLEQAELTLMQNKAQITTQMEKYNEQLYSLTRKLFDAREALEEDKLQLAAERGLFKNEVISRLDYDSAVLRVRKDKAETTDLMKTIESMKLIINAQNKSDNSLLKSTNDVVNLAQRNEDNLEPKANMTGEIESVPVQVGEHIHEGTPLVRLASAKKYNAILSIPQANVGQIGIGQKVTLQPHLSTQAVLTGHITQISPDLLHGMISVTVRIHGRSSILRPNLPVTGVIHSGEIKNTLYVEKPFDIKQEMDINVYRLSRKNHEAVKRKVHFGISSEMGIQILSGLKKGERIVLSSTSGWKGTVRIATNG